MIQIDAASLTDTGQLRETNEDSLGAFRPANRREMKRKGRLFIVADGMGGHRGGEVASKMAVETIRSYYYSSKEKDPSIALAGAFEKANRLIREKAREDESLLGMGTTCTAMVVLKKKIYFAHVGDSRAYLLRDGKLEQITQDHSLVAEMIRSGVLSREEARSHPQRNVITRSLGAQDSIQIDAPSSPGRIQDGDVFLLCSDGLTNLVSDEEIKSILEGASASEASAQLVDLANERGGADNISVQVVKVQKT